MWWFDVPWYWCGYFSPGIDVVKLSCFYIFSDNHVVYDLMEPLYGSICLWVFNCCANRFDIKVFKNWDEITFEIIIFEEYSARYWVSGHPCVGKQLAYYGRHFIYIIFISYFNFFGVIIRDFYDFEKNGWGIDEGHSGEV